MLGLDAIGRPAIGQAAAPFLIFTLAAATGSFSIAGNTALFQTSLTAAAGDYTITGYPSIPTLGLPSDGASFSISSVGATLTVNQLWTEKTQETEIWTEKVYGA